MPGDFPPPTARLQPSQPGRCCLAVAPRQTLLTTRYRTFIFSQYRDNITDLKIGINEAAALLKGSGMHRGALAVVSHGQGSAAVVPTSRDQCHHQGQRHLWAGAEPGWVLRLGMCPVGREPTPPSLVLLWGPARLWGPGQPRCPPSTLRELAQSPWRCRQLRARPSGDAENRKAALQQND